ncbi:MAG: DUF6351 family protein [Actinomycetota bacterium]
MSGRKLVRVLLAIGAVFATIVPVASHADPGLTIHVLSNRADLISGGTALVSVDVPIGVDPSSITMTLNDVNVTSEFAERSNGKYEGLLTGLQNGSNVLKALGPIAGAQITITNHSIDGSVFSGPQILPWACTSASEGPQCHKDATYQLYYKSNDISACNGGPALPVSLPLPSLPNGPGLPTGGTASVPTSCFLPYNPNNPPSDVQTTTTDQGNTVPYIIRLETGNEDRDQYQIASLYDPKAPAWEPWAPYKGWNGKLEIVHGAACGVFHGEGTAPGILDDEALSRGFATMSTALDNAGHNCNIAVQAESLMMAKEHLIDELGPIRYTIATGCSGGSLVQNQVANAYPGIYDGLLPQCTFPDAWSSATDVIDCYLMEQYWENPTKWAPGVVWTERQEAAAGGHFSDSVCHSWTEVFPFWETGLPGNPPQTAGLDLQNCGVPATKPNDPNTVYNAQTNPHGVRCTLSDYMINIFGVRPQDGFANRPFSNEGVQYGLQALEHGDITPAQFVDLNANAGGRDIDFNPTTYRTHADEAGVIAAYRSGAVNMTNNFGNVAIIDQPLDNVEIHEEYRAFAISAREDQMLGTHANHVIWYGQGIDKPDSFLTMDAWLAKVEQDHSSDPLFTKIVRAKEALGITDHCYLGKENIPNQELCEKLMGPYEGTRAAAGGPFAGNVIDCTLKPLAKPDYFPVQFSDAEWATLQQTFPTGVCDWSKPGIGEQPTIPWQTYGTDSTHIYGGEPLGPPPVSTSL